MRQRLSAEIDAARAGQDAARLCTLRLMKAAIDDRERALRERDEEAASLGDAEITEILATMIRQREESVRGYEEAGRLELAEQERREADVIREFLPKPLSDDEARAAVAEAIATTKAASLRDMGAVMGRLKRRYAGRMDFCKAGAQIRSVLR
ncbi:MAG: GatB/YqeY domain-containing protein [Paracoccaceae bacterium]